MDDAQKPVIDRMKAEGQLIRNTGTNSIKSINVRLDKFSEVFESIKTSIENQTAVLSETIDLSQKQFALAQSEAERDKRRADLSRVGKTDINDDDGKGRRPSPERSGANQGLFANVGQGMSGIQAFLAGGLGGGAAVGVLRTFASTVLLRILPAILLAPGVANFLEGFVESSLQNLNLLDNEGFSAEFRKSFASALSWPIIGFALGGWWGMKIGAMFALGGVLWDWLDGMFNAEENMQRMAEAFGLNLPDGWQGWVGSAIGFAIVSVLPTIIRRALIPLLIKAASALAAAAAGAIGVGGLLRRGARTATPRPARAARGAARTLGIGQRLSTAAQFMATASRTIAPQIARRVPGLGAMVPTAVGAATLTDRVDNQLQEQGITPESVGSERFEQERANISRQLGDQQQQHFDRFGDLYESSPEQMLQIEQLLQQTTQLHEQIDALRGQSTSMSGDQLERAQNMIQQGMQSIRELEQQIEEIQSNARGRPPEPLFEPPSRVSPSIAPSLYAPPSREENTPSVDLLSRRIDDADIQAVVAARQDVVRSISENAATQIQNLIIAPTNVSPTNVVQGPTTVSNVSPTSITTITTGGSEYGGLAGLA